ncbi:MAG: peptidylprolyl isomerase [Dehalococcoidales bacterium]
MAKKGKIEKPKREFTRRQLSRWQQQKKRQRIILGAGAFIILAALAIVGLGWYFSQHRPMQQTIIRVNDTEFNMDYYIKMLKLFGGGQTDYYAMYGMADDVVKVIERNELVRQGAMELDISVSDEEVDKELRSFDPPISEDYRDAVRTEMLISKLRDEHFEQMVPKFAVQRHIMAMLLESESQATEVRGRLESGEDFGELAGELSLESFSTARNGDLGWHPKEVLAELPITPVLGDYGFSANIGVLSQPIHDETVIKNVGYWLIEVLEREEEPEEARVQAMLLGSEEWAWQVWDELEAGGKFANLAKELSQHEASKESGGKFNWLSPGTMSPAFDEFVFNCELGTISEPIRDDTVVTTEGYWLIEVLDEDDNRELSDEDRALLVDMALNEWVSSLWDNPENEIDDSYLDDERKAWAINKAIEG